MAEVTIAIAAVYACMGVYNGVKTCISIYQDAKRFKNYMLKKRKPAETLSVEFNSIVDDDEFYVICDESDTTTTTTAAATTTNKVVSMNFFTMIDVDSNDSENPGSDVQNTTLFK